MALINLAEIWPPLGEFERLSDTENAVAKNREHFFKAINSFILKQQQEESLETEHHQNYSGKNTQMISLLFW